MPERIHFRQTRGWLRPAVSILALAVAYLVITAAPAFAVLSHAPIEKEFVAGANCGTVEDVGVWESGSTLYVLCASGPGTKPSIRKFNLNGNPVAFSGSGPYLQGNEITGSPTSQLGYLGSRMAVDNGPLHNGDIYVVSASSTSYASTNIDVFNPAGEWITAIPASGTFPPTMMDVDVGPEGNLYMIAGGGAVEYIAKYDAGFHEIERLYTAANGLYLRLDSSGDLWTRIGTPNGPSKISLYEPSGFSKNLAIGFESPQAQRESVTVLPSPLFQDPILESTDLRNFDIDPNNDDLYIDRTNRIETWSPGTPEEPPHPIAPAFGTSTLKESSVVAATADNHIFASKRGGEIVKFGPGDILPDITTPPASVDDVGHTSAVIKAHIDLAGGTPVTACKVQYGPTTSYSGTGSGVASCSPNPASGEFTQAQDVEAELTGLKTGSTYHYRFSATNAKGENFGIDRTVVPAYVLGVKTLAADEVEDHKAVLHGSLDPDGMATSYHFEYGVDTTYGTVTPDSSAGEGSGAVPLAEELADLPAGKLFHYRLVATNANGTTYGQDETFRTGGTPNIGGVQTTEVAESSAILNATIDPAGYDTEYRFEYGPTDEYGLSTPIPNGQIPANGGPTSVSEQVEGLETGTTYHFRVVATNRWGVSTSPDTTFDYAPPKCPNDHVRQQTISSYLPDCRAYELVSPGNAGAVALVPSQTAWDGIQNLRWVVNNGLAESPSRFAFFGTGGVINGLDAPNSTLDTYMATRTDSGWVTTLPGLTGSEAEQGTGKECSESMDLCVDHTDESAPYLFTAEGKPLGQLPENVRAIPGGRYFSGAERLAGDGKHFFFSSTNVAFTADGVSGGVGSAYEDNRETRTINLISTLPGGGNIPKETGSEARPIEFPAVSSDGSNVLMQTPGKNHLVHLYDRIDGVTYEIADGRSVSLIGAIKDATKVVFVSSEQLTSEDTDSSKDIYMWSLSGEEEGKPLQLISQGNGEGNGSGCSPSWGEGCSAVPLTTERGHPAGLASVPGLDDPLAEESGDVYFYSPEVLDPNNPGISGQRNLYLFRHGAAQLVAVLDPGTQINRIQISPDGHFAAFLTASHLTSYNNKTYKEMYTYDAETGVIRCASCNPSGLPPTADVEASEGGRFMSNDGRAFFATKDSLVPRDTDGNITDVYEYVGGRPQLISSGFAARDFTGGNPLVNLEATAEYTGLEGVSRNGSDVFFSTFDTLVSEDRNGSTVKFYDARTGGGFPTAPNLPLCAAADECHGEGSSESPPPVMSTGAALGEIGNYSPSTSTAKPKKQPKKKVKKKSKKAKKKAHRHNPRKHARKSHE